MTGNPNTTSGKATVGAAVGLILWRMLAAFVPELAGDGELEAAVVLVGTWAFCQYVPKAAFNGVTRGAAVAVLAAGLLAAGCTTIKTRYEFDPPGSGQVAAKEKETCVFLPCTDPDVVQATEGSFSGIRIGNPTGAGTSLGNLVELGFGGASQLSAPKDSDICIRSGVELDAAGNLVSADRETCTGQLERASPSAP